MTEVRYPNHEPITEVERARLARSGDVGAAFGRMTKRTEVRAHPRKGTRGVRQHSRTTHGNASERPVMMPSPLTEQDMEDLLVTALEGGSNYWYWLPDLSMVPKSKEPTSILIFRAAMGGARIPIDDIEDRHRLGYITREGMESALGRMLDPAKGNRRQATEILRDNMDGDSADAWLQFAVMGEQVYA